MDILYRKQRATVFEVLESLPEPPTYSAVRGALRILEEKGHIRHEKDGAKYVFVPTMNQKKARRSAAIHLVQTFFDGSLQQAVSTLMDVSASKLSQAELDQLAALIDEARKRGRK